MFAAARHKVSHGLSRTQSISRKTGGLQVTPEPSDTHTGAQDQSSPRSFGSAGSSLDVEHTNEQSSPSEHSFAKKRGAKYWFRQPLEKQTCDWDHGRRVPVLLIELRRALQENHGLAQEGIFRQSPEHQVLQLVRQRLESGEDVERALVGCSNDVLAALLKEWFRELPGGLWAPNTGGNKTPSRMGKAHLRAAAEQSSQELENALLCNTGGDRGVAMLLKQALRPQHRECLLWLLDLLVEAAREERSSRMGLKQLALIFAPVMMPSSHFSTQDRNAMQQLQRAKDGANLCEKLITLHLNVSAGGTNGTKVTACAETSQRLSSATEEEGERAENEEHAVHDVDDEDEELDETGSSPGLQRLSRRSSEALMALLQAHTDNELDE